MTAIKTLPRVAARPTSAVGKLPRPLVYWRVWLGVSAAIATGALTLLMTMQASLQRLGATDGGPFWNLPVTILAGVALLAVLCLWCEATVARTVAVICFGLATMGVLAFIEPLGVFHDSWQNVGLGRL